MPRTDGANRLNVIGVSANPKVLQAIAKAAKSRNQIVENVQLVTRLTELPAALKQIDASLETLVFLDHPPLPDPEVVQAFEQVYAKNIEATVCFLSEKDPERLPDEFRGAGVVGVLTPPFEVSRFQRVINGMTIPYR